jgi:alkylated DNA repair dioxygenase AlkB
VCVEPAIVVELSDDEAAAEVHCPICNGKFTSMNMLCSHAADCSVPRVEKPMAPTGGLTSWLGKPTTPVASSTRKASPRSRPPLAARILANSTKIGKPGKCVLMEGGPGAWYVLIRDFFALERVDFRSFWDTHPQEKKQVRTPDGSLADENRWSQFYNATGGGEFTYAGLRSTASAIAPESPIKIFLEKTQGLMALGGDQGNGDSDSASTSGELYDSVLVNWYEPDHTIGSHSDDEKDHITGVPIFSYSLGGTRRFVFHHKNGGPEVADITLRNGDLIVMGGTMQQFFKHSVPKIRKKDAFDRKNRINLTVRAFRAEEQQKAPQRKVKQKTKG